MKKDKEIKEIINRLQEINAEKEPFLPVKHYHPSGEMY